MIRFEDVHKRYGSVHAVRGLDLSVNEGEFLVLIGPSGCGKTTALKMVNRLIVPTSGTVRVGGVDVADLNVVELRRDIGYVIQETGLFPNMTIAQNVALVPRLKKWPKARREARVDELLHLVGLDPAVYRNRYPRHLSGGQRQRVGVARALAADPPIILMDEPFGATDPITRKQLQRELAQIKQQVKKTILFVTHDISEAFLLGDSVCLLRDGQVVQHASPEEILRRPADNFVREFIGDEALLRQFEYLQMGEIARTPLPTFPSNTTVSEAIGRLTTQGASTAAVTDGAHGLIGIINLAQLQEMQHPGRTVGDLPMSEVVTARSDELIRDCFPRLYERRPGHSNGAASSPKGLVVIDRQGSPQGIVGYSEVVRLIAGLVTGSAVAGNGSASGEDVSASHPTEVDSPPSESGKAVAR